jgi:hypothetical protein
MARKLTSVVNLRYQTCDVRIDRTTKWGNPFKIGVNGDSRGLVIKRYWEYIQTRPDLIKAIPELKGKRLGCWCHPLPCHGDLLAILANG